MTPLDTARELVPAALDAFGAKVRAVPADRWQAPTPCTDWAVRDLVNHLTSEHLWAPHLLRGETMAEVGDRYDGDVLGDDPVAAWDAAAPVSREMWQSVVDPERPVSVSFGEIPTTEYAEQMHLDLVVHGWDLARGAGLDETVNRRAAEHILAYVEPRIDQISGAGIFAPPVEIESDDPGWRLLALLGRDPR